MAKKKKTPVFESPFNTYQEITLLGEGGSGRVYKVEDDNGKIYALKCLNPQRVTKEKTKRFKNELLFCSRNQHNNVLKVLDWGKAVIDEIKCPFYVMPFYPKTLRALIENGIAHQRVLPLFSQILDGVEAAHLQKVWHRDLKPENILYDDSTDCLIVADFGIAHFSAEILQTSLQTKTGTRLANFQYAAPEQREQGNVDHRADIYALGMILNEMFTGTLLQGTGYKTIVSIAPEFSYLDALVDLMIRQSPSDRPQSIDEIKKELIGRQNEFVVRQRLGELKKTVIPDSQLDDPLINEPVKLIAVDYLNGNLVLKLSQRVTSQWIHAFRNIRNFSYYRGKEPVNFGFHENTASIAIEEQFAQKMTDMFKDYLNRANEEYKRMMFEQKHQKERAERQTLQNKIQEEEKRQRILKNVKI
ncbi:serine/threonine protein kinase, bacterial [Anaerolineae bacterium]|nr:serine/threonine protein kinase, bacterial [Anaerolineae bacterium]